MLFNSVEFFAFLAVVLLVYYQLGRRAQNAYLLVASYVFYGWWDWRFLTLIALSTATDYVVGAKMGEEGRSDRSRHTLLIVSLAMNLGLLGVFKYFNFFISSFTELMSMLGFSTSLSTLAIILPVGISFYTFQTLSYTIDIYRKKLRPVHDPLEFALFVSFFPQLVAGPIERASALLPQIAKKRTVTNSDLSEGAFLILTGLFRKVVIADSAAGYVNEIFSNPAIYPSSALVLGAFLFSIQIYGDFSGYSDIARGTAQLLGFRLMINFEQPYFSTSITEFWRRWHISLSTWLRDYLYIPLGGNRDGPFHTYKNLFITMLLGGLWHGAAWGFVIWGALHGAYLAIHKVLGRREPRSWLPIRLAKGVALFVLVSLTWIPFREPNGARALEYLGGVFAWHGSLLDTANPGKVLEPGLAFALCALALLAVDVPMYLKKTHVAVLRAPFVVRVLVYTLMLVGLLLYGGRDEVPFIYFQF